MLKKFHKAKIEDEIMLKNEKKLKLRLVRRHDVDGIWQNFNDVIAERIYLPDLTPVVTDWEKKAWLQNLIDLDNICVVAIDPQIRYGNQVAGQVTLENLSWDTAKHVGLLGIIVQKDYRDLGLGFELINFTKKMAQTKGKKKIILSTFSTNERGIRLYEKCGFERIGVHKKQYYINDEYVDELLMECFLESF